MTKTTYKAERCTFSIHRCCLDPFTGPIAGFGKSIHGKPGKWRATLSAACLLLAITVSALSATAQTDNYDAAIAQAGQSLQKGDYDTAIARANDALQVRPGDKVAKDLMTRASVRKSMQGPAPTVTPTPAAQTATQSSPPPSSTTKANASSARPKAGYDSAMASAKAALKREDFDEAEADANQALKARPKDAAAQSILVQTKKGRAEKKEHDRAMAEAQKAMNSGDYPRAVNLLTLVVDGWPNDVVAKDMLAAAKQGKPYTPPPATLAMERPSPTLGYSTNDSRIAIKKTKTPKNEVSASGDFFLGEGTITLPLGFSLRAALGSGIDVPVKPESVKRSSEYFGGTVSYSYGQIWYLDLSYAKGSSSGNQDIDTLGLGNINSHFTLDDTWYRAYVRYTFPKLRGKRFSAYLRGGVTYIDAKLTDDAITPAGRYTQSDKTSEYQGNLGFGLSYILFNWQRSRFWLNFEGEGFYGHRDQKSTETLAADVGLGAKTADISNNLYGGIARATLRYEYRFGQRGLFKVFGEGGFQGSLYEITYPSAGSQQETLYGPYVKVGLRYSF
jgi:tetratricopeptide (TPR) repeat protein